MQQLLHFALFFMGLFIYGNASAQQDTIHSMKPETDSGRSKQLKTVVITGQKTRLIEHRLDRIVVNANALTSTAGGNAIDVLNLSPGVLIDESGNVSLSGREGVMVYIDDKPVRLSGADLLNYLRSLPVSMIDQIELMPNPSSKYNADGTAIINIKLKKIQSRGFNGSGTLGAGFSRYFKSNNSLLLNYRNNRFNIFFNGGSTINNTYFISHRQRIYSYSNALLSYTLLQDVHEISHDKNGNYNLGIDYTVNNNTTLGILYNGFSEYYHETGKYNNRFLNPAAKPDSFIASNSRYSNRSVKNAVNMNGQHFFTKHRREINLNLDYLQYTNHSNQYLQSDLFRKNDPQAIPYELITEVPYTALIYSAKISYSDTLLGSVRYEPGVQTIHSARNNTSNYLNQSGNDLVPDPVLSNKFRYRENINAAYLNLQKNFNRFAVQAGIRVESTAGNALQYAMATKPDTSFSLHYTNFFPTLFLQYKLDSSGKNTLGFSAGKRIERPGYNDLNPSSFYFDRNTSNTGNSLLQPAFSTNWELSYSHNRNFTAGISFSNTSGLITRGYKQVGDAFIGVPVNVDHYTSIGASINWTINLTRWWTFNLNQELINRHYKGAVFNDGLYANTNLTTVFVKAYNQFKFKNGWSGDMTATYRSKLLLWQSGNLGIAQLHAGVQKKLNEKATITLAGTDVFHSAITRKNMNIQYAQVYYYMVFDTQKINCTFSYRFGKSYSRRERKTGIEAEAGRVN